MAKRFRLIFSILVGYIILQFLWWEILLVKQSNQIISEQQKLVALSSTNDAVIQEQIASLEHQKTVKMYMIVGEGTVFLLILLFGIYKVKQAIQKESELTRQQKNFILSVSHELKTPIASTKLQLQTLLKHDLDRDKQKTLLNQAIQETNRLNKLIEDVLLANQIQNNQFSIHLEELSISSMTHQITEQYFSEYIKKGQLKINIQEHLSILGDRVLMPSVIINLIENAIKYSFEHIDIQISLKKENHHVVLSVSDNGIGISEKEKEKVFDKFFRSGQEETRKTKGTGLGLYIVKQIIDSHQGQITIENNLPKGTIFRVFLKSI